MQDLINFFHVILYKFKNPRGFMLVDVLLAMVILSLSIVGIFTMFLQAVQVDTVGKDYMIATNLAQKQLELLKTYPPEYWDNLALPASLPWQDTNEPLLPKYQITTDATSSNDNNLVQVIVTTAWQEKNQQYNFQVITLYPKI